MNHRIKFRLKLAKGARRVDFNKISHHFSRFLKRKCHNKWRTSGLDKLWNNVKQEKTRYE